MTPTRLRLLGALLVLSTAAGWAVVRLVDAYAGHSLPVPWTAALVMLLLAIALALWARGTRARLEGRPGTKPMDPLVAARSAALAMAASRTGSLVAGFYLGAALGLVPGWDVAYVRERIIISLVTVVLAALVVAAALWLERICRVPPDDSDDPSV